MPQPPRGFRGRTSSRSLSLTQSSGRRTEGDAGGDVDAALRRADRKKRRRSSAASSSASGTPRAMPELPRSPGGRFQAEPPKKLKKSVPTTGRIVDVSPPVSPGSPAAERKKVGQFDLSDITNTPPRPPLQSRPSLTESALHAPAQARFSPETFTLPPSSGRRRMSRGRLSRPSPSDSGSISPASRPATPGWLPVSPPGSADSGGSRASCLSAASRASSCGSRASRGSVSSRASRSSRSRRASAPPTVDVSGILCALNDASPAAPFPYDAFFDAASGCTHVTLLAAVFRSHPATLLAGAILGLYPSGVVKKRGHGRLVTYKVARALMTTYGLEVAGVDEYSAAVPADALAVALVAAEETVPGTVGTFLSDAVKLLGGAENEAGTAEVLTRAAVDVTMQKLALRAAMDAALQWRYVVAQEEALRRGIEYDALRADKCDYDSPTADPHVAYFNRRIRRPLAARTIQLAYRQRLARRHAARLRRLADGHLPARAPAQPVAAFPSACMAGVLAQSPPAVCVILHVLLRGVHPTAPLKQRDVVWTQRAYGIRRAAGGPATLAALSERLAAHRDGLDVLVADALAVADLSDADLTEADVAAFFAAFDGLEAVLRRELAAAAHRGPRDAYAVPQAAMLTMLAKGYLLEDAARRDIEMAMALAWRELVAREAGFRRGRARAHRAKAAAFQAARRRSSAAPTRLRLMEEGEAEKLRRCQAAVRGFLARRRAFTLRAAIAAARTLQRWWRRARLYRVFHTALARRNAARIAAAVTVQKHVRRHQARQRYQAVRGAVRVLQSAGRAARSRGRLRPLSFGRAAWAAALQRMGRAAAARAALSVRQRQLRLLQRALRGGGARRALAAMQHAALLRHILRAQACARGAAARRRVRALWAAARLQRAGRGLLGRYGAFHGVRMPTGMPTQVSSRSQIPSVASSCQWLCADGMGMNGDAAVELARLQLQGQLKQVQSEHDTQSQLSSIASPRLWLPMRRQSPVVALLSTVAPAAASQAACAAAACAAALAAAGITDSAAARRAAAERSVSELLTSASSTGLSKETARLRARAAARTPPPLCLDSARPSRMNALHAAAVAAAMSSAAAATDAEAGASGALHLRPCSADAASTCTTAWTSSVGAQDGEDALGASPPDAAPLPASLSPESVPATEPLTVPTTAVEGSEGIVSPLRSLVSFNVSSAEAPSDCFELSPTSTTRTTSVRTGHTTPLGRRASAVVEMRRRKLSEQTKLAAQVAAKAAQARQAVAAKPAAMRRRPQRSATPPCEALAEVLAEGTPQRHAFLKRKPPPAAVPPGGTNVSLQYLKLERGKQQPARGGTGSPSPPTLDLVDPSELYRRRHRERMAALSGPRPATAALPACPPRRQAYVPLMLHLLDEADRHARRDDALLTPRSRSHSPVSASPSRPNSAHVREVMHVRDARGGGAPPGALPTCRQFYARAAEEVARVDPTRRAGILRTLPTGSTDILAVGSGAPLRSPSQPLPLGAQPVVARRGTLSTLSPPLEDALRRRTLG